MQQSLKTRSNLYTPFILAASFLFLALAGCGGTTAAPPIMVTPIPTPTPVPAPALTPFDTYKLTGDTGFIHDPSIIRQGTIYYAFTTDPGANVVASNPGMGLADGLQIRCSTDKVAWKICGQVFSAIPPAVLAVFPTLNALWAPDVSFFNGLYHVYYAASGFGANHSLIGLATSPTLEPTDPAYHWTDRGIVLQSQTTDNFNAIDPNILVDTDTSGNPSHVWMQYGSFWGGIYQREIDPATGLLSTANTAVVNLATRPAVTNNPIEGPSLVKKNGYYYLFVSFDYCCQTPITNSNYKIAVGRSTSANGPFADQTGTAMLQGGGTVLLAGNGTTWIAPGGQTVYLDPVNGDLITFHALKAAQNYLDYLFVNTITWTGDWPTIQP